MGGRIYSAEQLKKMALKAIEKYKLIFITDVEAYLPVSRVTLWNKGVTEDEDVIEALNENKINIKVGLRQKWYKSNNASLQISLYKLAGTAEERDILNSQKIDVNLDDQTKLTPEERAKRILELQKKLDGNK